MPRRPTVAVLAVTALLTEPVVAGPLAFAVTINPDVRAEAYSGRIYVALTPAERRGDEDPVEAMHGWFDPPPVFAVDVTDVRPGEPVTVGADALGHPFALDALPAGRYRVQAAARVDPDGPKAGLGDGDLLSAVRTLDLDPAESGEVALTLEREHEPMTFPEVEGFELLEIRSERLSAFLGRERRIRAGVALPEGYGDDPERRYPVIVWIGGFGGDHFDVFQIAGMIPEEHRGGVIVAAADPSNVHGHSVFANSAVTGPWADALVEELLPALDERYRTLGPEHRYVTGASSGGWASLWLQLTEPGAFAGAWSHVPDPVDFRDFQRIDLYAEGASMYVDEEGGPRPLARGPGGRAVLFYRDFVAREGVLGPGGQIGSFEAVFGPASPERGALGSRRPVPAFDRGSGAVDREVIEHWRRYDVSRVLRETWAGLEPEAAEALARKIRVYAGGADNFYLEGSAELLKRTAAEIGAGITVEIVPGMPHTIHEPAWRAMFEHAAERAVSGAAAAAR